MRILYLLHAPFELPGFIENWAAEKGFQQTYCSPYAGEIIPPHSSFNFLIVMGGPQSPLELNKDPYLKDEIELIGKAMKAKIPVLGFCLGAQLIGEALGARTERSPFKEVGIFPIRLTEDGKKDPLLANLPKEFPIAHWHNDMPGLTKDSLILAESSGCPRQVIRYLPLAYGFQCHPEMTKQGAHDLIDNCPCDLSAGPYIQAKEELFEHDFYATNFPTITCILENFLGITKKLSR